MRNPFAHGLDHSCGFHAHRMGQLHRVKSGALVHINEIQAYSFMGNADLAISRFTDIPVNQFELLWSAMRFDYCC
jgi:hypothetical protein